jgi:hypothetical protein
MNLTLARVKAATRLAMTQNGITGTVVRAYWHSTGLCTPKSGGPKFKHAGVIIEVGGREVKKFVTVEDNGGWSVK